MRTLGFLAITLLSVGSALAQGAFTRTELGIKGAFLGNDYSTERALGGVGGRYILNFTSLLAADADFTFYPQFTTPIANRGGRQFTFFAGLKGGVRRNRFGYFFKARPGLRHYTETAVAGFEPNLSTPKTHFSFTSRGIRCCGSTCRIRRCGTEIPALQPWRARRRCRPGPTPQFN